MTRNQLRRLFSFYMIAIIVLTVAQLAFSQFVRPFKWIGRIYRHGNNRIGMGKD